MKIGRRRDYLVFDPDLVEELLTASEQHLIRGFNPRLREVMGNGILSTQGAVHDDQRKRLKPLFVRTELAKYAPTIVRIAIQTFDGWREGKTFDMAPEMLSLSFRIIVEILFGRDAKDGHRLSDLSKSTIPITGRTGYIKRFIAAKFRSGTDSEIRRMKAEFDGIICPWITENRSTTVARCPAMIHRLISVHDRDMDSGQNSDRQTRDELVSFLFAGHETTAMAVSWTLWLLSQNREAASNVYEEVKHVIGAEEPTIDDLPRLTYTTAALREALRLYPPVWLIARRAIDDWQLGPYAIPARSYIHASPYVTHRDPRCYVDPQKYDPQRFIGGPYAGGRHRFAYFPFGGGDRRCLGDTFAQVEGVLILAALAQRWKLTPLPGISTRTQPLISLRPRKGLIMRVEPVDRSIS